jgi:hypothetical protein
MKNKEDNFVERLDKLIKRQNEYKLGKSLGAYYKEIISYCSKRV